jgi:hypothetical protein
MQDDLETTRAGYEEQMRNMCEHMAELNAKLAAQAEKIVVLQSVNHAQQQQHSSPLAQVR